ncbi:hypothetical protein N0V83_001669 [Neocucurbitaria cava]|uniref:Protein kinase domain-containing protein n=1 Tax=Neocucurbitaria cava TaxID=798079 RepID=A0A9W9CQM1_9PLEO|nr:hypothetical protein N0V83_001669 [Neocucurbitaria cava]
MDLEVDPRETNSLKELAQSCAQQLHQIAQEEETREANVNARDGFWASRQSAEFNLWCSKIGVNSEGLRSIDVRLKDVPEICKLLQHLLQSLHHDLLALYQYDDGAHTQVGDTDNSQDDTGSGSEASSLSFASLSSSEDSQSNNTTDGPLEPGQKGRMELTKHISDTIDRLQGQARRIERAGAQHRRTRIELYRNKERPKQIYEGLKKLGIWKANDQFKAAPQIVKERMAESFARRRIRFEYIREHQKKRAKNGSAPPLKSNDGDTEAPIEQKKVVPIRSDNLVTTHPHDQRTLFSETVNTRYDLPPERRKKPRAESVRSIALRHPGFLPPPQIQGGKFQCPYCLLEFREREAENSRWSQHVMQDFEPYFCTVEDCEAPFDIPNSFDDLLDHLQSHVPVRHHIDEPDGEHREYLEKEFEHHIKSHGEVSDETMATMKEASRRKGAFLFDSCPFCGGYPDVLEKRFPDRDALDAQNELRKHIKQHMQEIALFLPPYRSDILDEDDDLKGSDVTRRRSKTDETIGDPDDFLEHCGREDCDDCKSAGEDLKALDPPEIQIEHTTKQGWTCCRCGNNYSGVNYCAHCEGHEKCQKCITYERDCSLDGNWTYLLDDKSVYDRSDVTDDDLFTDERLQPFIMSFAFRSLESIQLENKNDHNHPPQWVPASERADAVRRVAENHFDFREEIAQLHEHPPFATATNAEILRYLLVYYGFRPREASPALWIAAGNGQLDDARQLLANQKLFPPDNPHESLPKEDVQAENTYQDGKIDYKGHSENELDPTDIIYHDGVSYLIDALEHVDEGDRTEAFYEEAAIWIEWKTFDYETPQSERKSQRNFEDHTAVLKTLNEGDQAGQFRIPRCLGYFKETEIVLCGFVFEKPNSFDRVVSLRDLLTSTNADLPTLADRIRLMYLLYATIKHFHASRYAYYNIRSDSILFFRSNDPIEFLEFRITQPYMSGSAFSGAHLGDLRIGKDKRPTYAFPKHDLDDYIKMDEMHDLYSLGIVLLEIAHWKPLDEIIDISMISEELNHSREVRTKLLSLGEPHVLRDTAHVVGEIITGLIRACLEGVSDSDAFEKFQCMVQQEFPGTPSNDREQIHQSLDVEYVSDKQIKSALETQGRDSNRTNIAGTSSSAEDEEKQSAAMTSTQTSSQSRPDQIQTPPDSSDDDEPGHSIGNLRGLQEALQHIDVKRVPEPDSSGLAVDREEQGHDRDSPDPVATKPQHQHTEAPHETYSDVSSAYVSPYLDSFETDQPSPLLNAQNDPQHTHDPVKQFGQFNLNDSNAHISPSHSLAPEGRIRTVRPPSDGESEHLPRPKGILKRPTSKFPEENAPIREGVSLSKVSREESGIPAGARWTKIDRRLVDVAALEEAKERFEERLDFIVSDRHDEKDTVYPRRRSGRSYADTTYTDPSDTHDDKVIARRVDNDLYYDTYSYRDPPVIHTHGERARRQEREDLVDNAYSYTDPASMYRDTEPAWRVDRSQRSAREFGPPPSTRGFDRINARATSEVEPPSSPRTREYVIREHERPTSLLERPSIAIYDSHTHAPYSDRSRPKKVYNIEEKQPIISVNRPSRPTYNPGYHEDRQQRPSVLRIVDTPTTERERERERRMRSPVRVREPSPEVRERPRPIKKPEITISKSSGRAPGPPPMPQMFQRGETVLCISHSPSSQRLLRRSIVTDVRFNSNTKKYEYELKITENGADSKQKWVAEKDIRAM